MTTSDPYQDAMGATFSNERTYFGLCQIEAWHCALVKGQGKVPFDPNQHAADQRRVAITIIVEALASSKQTFNVERELIAESQEWTRHTLPSLKALSLDLRTVNSRYVQVKLLPTGRKYTNAAGEEREATAIVFVAAYPDEAACEQASQQFWTGRGGTGGETKTGTSGTSGVSTNNSAERETAKKFLPALWKQSGGDLARFAEILGKTPIVSRHFTIESPEVISLITPF